MIEIGHHHNIDREFRHCPFCETLVEDEYHFILICPLYSNLRELYIPTYYCNIPTIQKFENLMSSENVDVVRKLAMYIYYALKDRSRYMSIYQ